MVRHRPFLTGCRKKPFLHLSASPVHQLRLEMDLSHVTPGISHIQKKEGARFGCQGAPVQRRTGQTVLHIFQLYIRKHHGIGRKTVIGFAGFIDRKHHALYIPGLFPVFLLPFLRCRLFHCEIKISGKLIIRTGNGNRNSARPFRKRRGKGDRNYFEHIAKVRRKRPIHVNLSRLIYRPALPRRSPEAFRKSDRQGNRFGRPVEMIQGNE